MPYITTLVTCSALNGCTELWLINNWTSTEHHHSIDNYYDVFEQVPQGRSQEFQTGFPLMEE